MLAAHWESLFEHLSEPDEKINAHLKRKSQTWKMKNEKEIWRDEFNMLTQIEHKISSQVHALLVVNANADNKMMMDVWKKLWKVKGEKLSLTMYQSC